MSHLKEQLSHATEQRDSLQMQLDSINTKSALLESQLHQEKSKSRETQVFPWMSSTFSFIQFPQQSKLESLESNNQYTGTELKHEMGHRIKLQKEIISVRKELKMTKENISSLESQAN